MRRSDGEKKKTKPLCNGKQSLTEGKFGSNPTGVSGGNAHHISVTPVLGKKSQVPIRKEKHVNKSLYLSRRKLNIKG